MNGFDMELIPSIEDEAVETDVVFHKRESIQNNISIDKCTKVYYITDIHLDYKIKNKLPPDATESEVTVYIRQLVEKMVNSADCGDGDTLLIGGDISFDFNISKIFYSELTKLWCGGPIVAILGNHELWVSDRTGILKETVNKYRRMFKDMGIFFLQNALFVSNRVITESELKSTNSKIIRQASMESPIVILGGLGFSGFNLKYNAESGLYKKAITTLDEDEKETKRFEEVYKKINQVLGNRQVIIFTHMPKENWSCSDYNSNWIYVNGHTHRNEYHTDKERTVYADNQIGYSRTSVGLKYFYTTNVCDIFKDYPNGKHIISRGQYFDFNREKDIDIQFNRDGKIHMLKRDGIYFFILENEKSGTLYSLNGGKISKLEHKSLDYYFKNMSYLSEYVINQVSHYQKKLNEVSSAIKKFGGSGSIHGCIADIDFFNHIFLNPLDGSITPYFAYSIVEKLAYKDIPALLLERRPDLYKKYLDSVEAGEIIKLQGASDSALTEMPEYVTDTSMYKLSNAMRSIQYLIDDNVIRLKPDPILNVLVSKNQIEGPPTENMLTPYEKSEDEYRTERISSDKKRERDMIGFQQTVNEYNENIDVLEYMPGENVFVMFNCLSCKHNWWMRAELFIKNPHCPKCKK